MGIEPTSEACEAALPIMRLCCELVQICRAGLELAYSGRCGPPQPSEAASRSFVLRGGGWGPRRLRAGHRLARSSPSAKNTSQVRQKSSVRGHLVPSPSPSLAAGVSQYLARAIEKRLIGTSLASNLYQSA